MERNERGLEEKILIVSSIGYGAGKRMRVQRPRPGKRPEGGARESGFPPGLKQLSIRIRSLNILLTIQSYTQTHKHVFYMS